MEGLASRPLGAHNPRSAYLNLGTWQVLQGLLWTANDWPCRPYMQSPRGKVISLNFEILKTLGQ